MASPESFGTTVTDIAQRFTGTILRPTDADYDDARRVHNGLIDKRPALVARCRSVADVVDAVHLARTAGSRSRSAAAATTSPAGPPSTAAS